MNRYFCLGKDTKWCHSGLQQESRGSLSSFFLLSVIQGALAWNYFRSSLNKQAAQVLESHLNHHVMDNSPSPPIQFMGFHLGSFLFECMSIKQREKHAGALSWFSSLESLLWQRQQANCDLVPERKTIMFSALSIQLSPSPSYGITAAFFFGERSFSWEGCLSIDENGRKPASVSELVSDVCSRMWLVSSAWRWDSLLQPWQKPALP